MTSVLGPQTVRWRPSDGGPAGIYVWNEDKTEAPFIPWSDLQEDLQKKLLPQLFAKPQGYSFATNDYHGKKEWLVQIVNDKGEAYCDVWFGNNPDEGWGFDGMVRVGDSHPSEAPYVWQTYQRFSDGSYRRQPSPFATIDELVRIRK
jgi:hypothetical protein